MRLAWLFGALILSLALLTLHLFALENFWYWKYEWYDIPMHALGGLTLGTFIVAVSPRPRPVTYLLGIAVVLTGWEVMEYVSGITRNEPGYVLDTALDLLDGTIGATASYALARLTLWR